MMEASLRKELIFSVLIQIFIMIVGLSINKLISINFGVESYSTYSIFKNLSAVISFTMLSGMGIALPKFLAVCKSKKKVFLYFFSAAYIILIISIILFCILFLFSDFLNTLIFLSNDNKFIFLCFFYGLAITFSSFIFAYLRGVDRIIEFSLSQLFVQILILITAFIFNKSMSEFFFYCIAFIVSFNLFFLARELFKNNKYLKLILSSENIIYMKELWNYGYSRLIGDIFLFLLNTIPIIVINKKFGLLSGAYFASAILLTSLVKPILSYVGVILLPKISKLNSLKQKKEITKLVNKFLFLFIIISIVVIIFIYLFKTLLLSVFFSASFVSAKEVVALISLSILPHSVYLLIRNIVDALSKVPYNTFTVILSFLYLSISLFFSNSLFEASIHYCISSLILGLSSLFFWYKIKMKLCL